MNDRQKQARIGLFVLGALALLVGGVVTFGSGRLFTSSKPAVMFFEGSVKGLNVGSAVMFEGVKIGEVSDIHLIADLDELKLKIPVIVAIDTERFSTVGPFDNHKDYIEALVAKGLRAQLQMQSMVTGQMVINLALYPTPPVFRGDDHDGDRDFAFDYPEIPTIPSTSQALQQMLEGLPVREIVERAQSVLVGVDRLVNSPEIKKTLSELNHTLIDLRELSETLNRDVPPLTRDARQTFAAATAVIERTDRWLSANQDVAKTMATDLSRTMTQLRATLTTTEATLQAVKTKIGDERMSYQLQGTLREVGEAARSLRQLSDYLELHPEALLRGRAQGG